MAFQEGLELRAHGKVMVFWPVPGLHCSNQTWSSSSTCKIHHKPAGLKGYGKNRMPTTKIRKIEAAIGSRSSRGTRRQYRGPSQPGGPTTEGPADLNKCLNYNAIWNATRSQGIITNDIKQENQANVNLTCRILFQLLVPHSCPWPMNLHGMYCFQRRSVIWEKRVFTCKTQRSKALYTLK